MVTKPRRPEEDVGLRLLARMIARAHLKRIAGRTGPEAVGVENGIEPLRGEVMSAKQASRAVQKKIDKARRQLP